MRHKKKGRNFNRNSSHRKAMIKNMLNSLLKYELIKTTLPKAKELRRFLEPLITLAKKEIGFKEISKSSVSLRRQIFKCLNNKIMVKKLFEDIAPRYINKKGGYSRIIKCGYRFGDKSPMAFIELLGRSNNKSKEEEN